MAKSVEGLLAGLNPEQEDAVRKTQGPVLLLAGAGSGKTRVLVIRIAYLLALKLAKPSQVVAITFTNKAAKEMRERLRLILGKASKEVSLTTFHALGLRILRENYSEFGLPHGFAVLGVHERLSLVMTAARRIWPKNQKLDLGELAQAIGQLKEKGIIPEKCPDDTPFGARLGKVYKSYEKAKMQLQSVDLDDLIQKPIELLSSNASARSYYHSTWKYFMVDEFQDTNPAQMELIRLLTNEEKNVFVVGDDDQSIYAWRGAEIQNLMAFESYFPNSSILKLQQNYRSTRNIIEASNAVIVRNQLRREKRLFTLGAPGDPILHHLADDEKAELEWLGSEMKLLHEKGGLNWSDMAVLMRTNIQVREILEHLVITGIPFNVKGAENLVDLPEVQAVLAYAKAMINPFDELSIQKIITFPARGIFKDMLERIDRSDCSTVDSILNYCEKNQCKANEKAHELFTLIRRKSEESRMGSFFNAYEALLREAGVLDAFTEGERKKKNVGEFLELLKEEEASNPAARLSEVLSSLALDTQFHDGKKEKPGVKLMTIHAAKGLEFDTVFLPRLDDDVFPSKKSQTDKGIEEERRLFYVALTRAKRRLYLSWPASKVHYRVARDVAPSRFLHEIPEQFLDGPLGKRDLEGKKVFLDGFFSGIQACLSDGESAVT